MAIIKKGLIVSGAITPSSASDVYPTHVDIYGYGGYRVVNTLDELFGISESRKSAGMMVYVLSTSTIYILKQDGWQEWWDNQVSLETMLTDVRLDIINLRTKFSKTAQDIIDNTRLPFGMLWIGNEQNYQEPTKQIAVDNLPELVAAKFPLSNILAIPIPNPIFDPLKVGSYIMSSPWLPQTYIGKTSILDSQGKTAISGYLGELSITVSQIKKRIEHAGLVLKTRKTSWDWENPAYSVVGLVDNPLLATAMQIYDLNDSYIFQDEKVQVLDELKPGLLKQSPSTINPEKADGNLAVAVAGTDYVYLHNDPAGAKIALIQPSPEAGEDNKKFIVRSEIELKDIAPADAKYILQEAHDKLTKAQALSSLNGGILKTTLTSNGAISIAKGGGVPEVDDYVDPLTLQTEITETKAFATAEAVAAEAAAVVQAGIASTAYFVAQMLPYSLIPIVPVGTSISGAIGGVAIAAAAAQSSADTANTRIDNLTVNLIGDVIGTNNISDPIITVFTPNPRFTGKEYIKIPVGNIAERPSNPSVGMVRYNTEL